MDEGNAVQDENLVNDQVTQAIEDSGVSTDAPAEAPAPAVPTVPTEPVTPPPAPDPVPEPVVEPAADDATPDTGTAEASPLNTDPVSAPMVDAPSEEDEAPAEEPAAEDTPQIVTSSGPLGGGGGDDDLMAVKKQALEQLSPLVDHLDLPSDQKFDTYMEILRASDDKALVQPAFDEAQKIEDEDKKAQALLDVVNEVNYLTQDDTATE